MLSRGNYFFVLIPILAFIFCGVRYGLLWTGIISIFSIFLYMESSRITSFFPLTVPYEDPAFGLIISLELIIMILGLTFIISRSKSMAIDQLAINEERLKQKAFELEEKTNELELLKSELVVRNENLSKYAEVTAHDLKQPLRTITSFAELLKMKLQDSESKDVLEYLEFIISGGAAMKDQVDKVLDIANLSNEIVFSPLDTKEVIQQTLRMLNSQIKNSNAKVEIKDIPNEIIANEVSIKKVFQNLISNGIKFNNNGNIKIEISGIETPNEWQFLVKDNGFGMKKEVQNKIFNFGERATTDKEGTGIGLNICQKLINLHRGKIWVNSQQEKGSEFFFSINKNLQSI